MPNCKPQSAISATEWPTAWEVFSQYEGIGKAEFVDAMETRARNTDSPFRAYDCAHAICARLTLIGE